MREPRPISPAAIERRYRQANPEGHWFDPDTMRFFRSRLSQGFVDSLERVGFVSSEQTIFGPRRWSVRRLDPDGTLDNVREFQAFATRSEALAAAVRCARLAWSMTQLGDNMNHENAEKMLATLKELAQAANTHLVLDAALVRKHVATLYKIAIEESDSNDVVRSLANAQEMLDECIRRGPLLDESDLSKLDVAFSGLQESFRSGRRRSTSQAQ